ncbi:hypothetical protein [Clostridioides difficile]|uniref:hypothetical protein n=1 Tax=Clostridioides difficile TaxID=1496 RepID=UPI0002D5F48D|nr:hypothetical protein [Clostridioides difficile]EKJ1398653.1 hypothetical protein [Clostridioides difficile]MBY2231415.1 hypothetical protein [Clostridioides difficile]MCR1463252.1 hypothetical protein [Clostridioides difficile]MCV2271653.1 hypothetical protein [Clostridioides difficile]MDK3180618.1 hypothetical protein [Clostridioides difficile]
MKINVIEIFPKDKAKLNKIEMDKASWFVNIISKKYPKETLNEAFSTLEKELNISKANT